MKKALLIIVSIMLIISTSACGKKEEETTEKPRDYREEARQLIENTSKKNYEYTYKISSLEETLTYTGRIYNGLEKGVLSEKIYDSTDSTEYQIENDISYSPSTKAIMKDIYYTVSTKYIKLDKLTDTLKDETITCQLDNDTYNCNSVENETISIKYNDKYVTSIVINDGNGVVYEMTYSNFDNVDPIESIL